MKQLFCLIVLFLTFQAVAATPVIECEAYGTIDGNAVYEVKTTALQMNVTSQGTTIVDQTTAVSKRTELTIKSIDNFTENVSVEIFVRNGDQIIETDALRDISLNKGKHYYGVHKNIGNYRMRLNCEVF